MPQRTETVDNNETIYVHVKMGSSGTPVAAQLVLSGAGNIASNVEFTQLVNTPMKLQSGFGLIFPAAYAMGKFLSGSLLPMIQLLPYIEQDNLRKGASVNGLQVQAKITEVITRPDGQVAVWLKPQVGIIAILIGL